MAGVFATGNVLRAVESSGFAACEGGGASGRASSLPLLQPSVRVAADFARARLCLRHGGHVVWQSRRTRLLRQRRIHLDLTPLARHDGDGAAISLGIQPASFS
jgi:hypothetical protein